ncbi:hypothetical protein B7463_g941, partial [Scytalidium lignicola]
MLLRTALSAYTAHKVAENNANPNAPRQYYTAVDVPVGLTGRFSRRAYRRDVVYDSYPAPAPYYAPPQQPQVIYQGPLPPPQQQVYYAPQPQQSYPQGPAYGNPSQANQSYPPQYGSSQREIQDSRQPSRQERVHHEPPAEMIRAQYSPEPPSYQNSTSPHESLPPWSDRDVKAVYGPGNQATRQ